MKRNTPILLLSLCLALLAAPCLPAQNRPAQSTPKAGDEQKDNVSRAARQQRRSYTRSGNRDYKNKHYEDAESRYRLALKADSNYYKAQYNLGNAMYRQKNYADAIRHYDRTLADPRLQGKEKSQAYYNLGNSHLQAGLQQRQQSRQNPQGMDRQDDGGMQHFQQAVQDYQEALKLNSKNPDAKYNLSYAQKMLAQARQQNGGGQGQGNQGQQGNQKQQGNQGNQGRQGNQGNQGQQGNQGNQQKQGKQGNQQKQGQGNQDQQKQDQGKQKQGDQGKQGQNRQQQQQAQAQKEQKKREAEQLLGAVKNNEKNTMKDQMRTKESKVDGRIEKDW